MKAQWAAPIALVTAIAVATAIYGMPVDQAVLSAAEGATFGLFPIMWIVVAAIWVYNMTVESGPFAVLRRSIVSVSSVARRRGRWTPPSPSPSSCARTTSRSS
jgi:lactate permease